jgi:hypothetical protein
MREPNKIDIAELFSGMQAQMTAQLSTNRTSIPHAPSKGDSLENVWIEWLREYLPNRYNIDKAFVIDSTGQLSEQIDLVIYDQQYTPFVFSQNGIKYIPAEGVYAVFEVKPDLNGSDKNGSYIEYAGKKIESVRTLKRTSTFIVDKGKSMPARALTKIIGGILTSECSFKNVTTIGDHFRSLSGLETIDMACAVNYGGLFIDFEGEEDLSISDHTERIISYYNSRKFKEMKISTKDNSLVSFFLQLSRYLQQSIGTIAAIDFNAYAQNINFQVDEKL